MKTRKVETIELNESYQKVMHWFFSYPNLPITLSELAKQTGISKKTANKIVSIFLKEGFLLKENVGKSWRIHCNQSHFYNYSRKIAYNLALIYEALYKSEIIKNIYKVSGNPKTIILFGSYRKGDDNEKSDVDIAVEIAGNEKLKIIPLKNLQKFGYRKDVPINLHIFSRNKIDLNLFSNIANGIVIEGFLETKP